MKILNCLHRSDFGGAQRRVVWVGRSLALKGYSTIVLFPKGKDDVYEKWLNDQGVTYIKLGIPVLRRITNVLSNVLFAVTFPVIVLQIIWLGYKRNVSLLHVNGVTNLQPVIAGLFLGKPVLWHWNDMLTPRWFVALVAPLFRFGRIHLVVATSEITRKYSSSLRLAGKIETLPAPIPPFSKQNGSFSTHNTSIHGNRFVVGFVGNLLPAKGCFDYIECMQKLCVKNANIFGVMVGGELPRHTGILEQLKLQIGRYGLDDRIVLVGFQSDVRPWLKDFDVLLFPSHTEACPITVLEAMDAGVPVVSYAVGDVPEMLKGTKLSTCEVGDIDGLVQEVELVRASSPDVLIDLQCKLKDNARINYSLEAVVNQHERIYSEMLGGECFSDSLRR